MNNSLGGDLSTYIQTDNFKTFDDNDGMYNFVISTSHCDLRLPGYVVDSIDISNYGGSEVYDILKSVILTAAICHLKTHEHQSLFLHICADLNFYS